MLKYLLCSLWLLTICSCASPTNQNEAVPSYDILFRTVSQEGERQDYLYQVRIAQRLSPDELTRIIQDLERLAERDAVQVAFYLPGMQPEGGPWASAQSGQAPAILTANLTDNPTTLEE